MECGSVNSRNEVPGEQTRRRVIVTGACTAKHGDEQISLKEHVVRRGENDADGTMWN